MTTNTTTDTTTIDRTAAARATCAFGVESQKRAIEACDAITERLPDLIDEHGKPCPWAVDAYLRLKGASDRAVTPALVREERRKLLDVHRDRWGHDPTELARNAAELHGLVAEVNRRLDVPEEYAAGADVVGLTRRALGAPAGHLATQAGERLDIIDAAAAS